MRQEPQVITVWVRLVFITAIALLVAQSVFIHKYGEPYPTITMPSFKGSGGFQNGRVKIIRYEAVFIANGEEFSFKPKVLLEKFPDSHIAEISQSLMPTPAVGVTKATPTGRLSRLRDIVFPGYGARRKSQDSPAYIASLKDWLRSRGRELVPDRPVSRVEIRWYWEIFSMDGNTLKSERVPIDIRVVTFHGEPR